MLISDVLETALNYALRLSMISVHILVFCSLHIFEVLRSGPHGTLVLWYFAVFG
jgi:hypothetical protein